MEKYVLDTNIIITIWNEKLNILDKLLEENKLIIVKEVLGELSIKEKVMFKGVEVLSERFMKLVPSMIEIDDKNFKAFLKEINLQKGNGIRYYYNGNKLSKNDLLLIYVCSKNKESILVTEDKRLFKAASEMLNDSKVISLNALL